MDKVELAEWKLSGLCPKCGHNAVIVKRYRDSRGSLEHEYGSSRSDIVCFKCEYIKVEGSWLEKWEGWNLYSGANWIS